MCCKTQSLTPAAVHVGARRSFPEVVDSAVETLSSGEFMGGAAGSSMVALMAARLLAALKQHENM